MEDDIQVGCIRCKKTKRNQKAAEVVRQGLDAIVDAAFDGLQKQAKVNGVEIPNELHGKIEKWLRERGLLENPEGQAAQVVVPEEPASPVPTKKRRTNPTRVSRKK